MTSFSEPRLGMVPAAGPPTFSHDLLNPLHRHESAGPECLDDLMRGEVRMPFPQRTDANPGGGATIEGPPDLLLDRTAFRRNGATVPQQALRASGAQRQLRPAPRARKRGRARELMLQ